MPRIKTRVPVAVVVVAVLIGTVLAVVALVLAVDERALVGAVVALLRSPWSAAVALAAFGIAFALRSWAWTRVLPGVSFGQAWAAIHLALAGNHLLPLRLGEPLRVLSVVRRSRVGLAPATATTLTLRAADLLSLMLVTVVSGVVVLGHPPEESWLDRPDVRWLGVAGLVILLAAGLVWTARLRRSGRARLPGPGVLAATVAAWLAESALTLVAARAAGLDLTVSGAVLVGSAAVLSQVVAVTPGGVGTYEVGAAGAYLLLGHDLGSAVAAALTAHGLKTLYALALGGVALVRPAPSLLGRLRLPRPLRERPVSTYDQPPADASVVLFLPAHDEAATVAEVVSRAPKKVGNRSVVVLVVDDGSSDGTAEQAERAGAMVVGHATNRGLGAAVRTGLAEAVGSGAAAVAFCDADGEYAPEELADLVGPILDGTADYVVGSRFRGRIHTMRPHRRIGNLVLTRWVRWMVRLPVTDGQSGYRALSPAAARDAEIGHAYNYAQLLTLNLVAKGYRYAEVPISYRFRVTGRSFVRLGRYLRAVLPAVHRELNAPAGSPVAVAPPGAPSPAGLAHSSSD